MADQQEPVVVNSSTEAVFYVMLLTCQKCSGRVWPRWNEASQNNYQIVLPTTCGGCQRADSVTFDASRIDPALWIGEPREWAEQWLVGETLSINPTSGPSRVIDVADWLTLYIMLTTLAQNMSASSVPTSAEQNVANRRRIRRLQFRAGQCISEALKFYDVDNDLPPDDAFFTDQHRKHARAHPELFLRQRLTDLRLKLPLSKND